MAQTDTEKTGQIVRPRGGEIIAEEGKKSRGGSEYP
jgi:hypothetical protein